MFGTFFRFELRYWLGRWMLLIFLAIITFLVMAAMSSDAVRIGSAVGNTHRNAPFVIQTFYSVMALVSCLMITAFVNDAASRDFACNTSQLLFSKPMSKWSFLMGRFWGAIVIALIPILGISLAAILTPSMPWVEDPSKYGPIHWPAHIWGVLAFALPNTILIGAIIFAIAIWLRSTVASFIGIILILMFYGMTQSLVGNLDNETFAQLADPFGIATFQTQTRYWTNADKNVLALTLGNSMLLYNRLIWIGVGLLILSTACWRFSFSERRARKTKKLEDSSRSTTAVSFPNVVQQHDWSTTVAQILQSIQD